MFSQPPSPMQVAPLAGQAPPVLTQFVSFAEGALDRQDRVLERQQELCRTQSRNTSEENQRKHEQIMALVGALPSHNRSNNEEFQNAEPLSASGRVKSPQEETQMTVAVVASSGNPNEVGDLLSPVELNEAVVPLRQIGEDMTRLEAETQEDSKQKAHVEVEIVDAKGANCEALGQLIKAEAENGAAREDTTKVQNEHCKLKMGLEAVPKEQDHEDVVKKLERTQEQLLESRQSFNVLQSALKQVLQCATAINVLLEYLDSIEKTIEESLGENDSILCLRSHLEMMQALVHGPAEHLPQLKQTASIVEKFLELGSTLDVYEESLGMLARSARVLGVQDFEPGDLGLPVASTFIKLESFQKFAAGDSEDYSFVKRFAQLLGMIDKLNSCKGVQETEEDTGKPRSHRLLVDLGRLWYDYVSDMEEELYLNLVDYLCPDVSVLVYSAAFKAFADGDENENESLQILISQAVKNLSMIEDEDGDDKSACGHE